MSYSAIVTRIRAIVEAEAGSLRTITAGLLEGGLHGTLDDNEAGRRSLSVPIVETEILSRAPHAATFMAKGSKRLETLTLEIRIHYHLSHKEQLSDADRDAAQALVQERASDIEEALSYPGNFDQGTTGLASGKLHATGTTRTRLELPSGTTPGLLEAVLTMTGIVSRSQAVA